ncbi:interaptin [Drosophila montana]|uniref:interaptin n=1 Tax=Drosophila montana TaxID=40370 RepID=UPI00313BF8E5
MSWLNNSLNTIKGQLTNLAQEVLADTAGPGDDEYRGPELNTKTAVELLTETQTLKEQLENACEHKDQEIAALRKQVATLKSQKLSEGGGDADGDTKSLNSGEARNVEDSWCWEPAGSAATPTTAADSKQGSSQAGMVDVALVDTPDVSGLNRIIANLEQSNEELRNSLEVLDAQHELAMQDVLGQKAELQSQLMELKELQAERLVAHELEMARLKAQLADEQKHHQAVAIVQEQLQQRVEQQSEQLKRCQLELGEMQQLLDKRGNDNSELIERVRQADAEREKLQLELEELVKQAKEKKTSESSNSSSTGGKHSEDEFIVVRNTDATGSSSDPDPDPDADVDGDANATMPPTKEQLRNKLVALESRIGELSAANAKLQDADLERQLADGVRVEQVSELETRLRISESEKEQLQLELQRKLQQLMLQNQELKLNAEADQETHANDLEQQLGSLRAENRRLRQELDANIAQAKFRQAIAEEKEEITDLDVEPDEADSSRHLFSILESLLADKSDQALTRTYQIINDRLKSVTGTERQLSDLRKQQLMVEHDKKTLEADISQYVLQCDELMKNNETLLNELDKLKRNKLETIEEHHEETIAQLESQLEELQSMLQLQEHKLEIAQLGGGGGGGNHQEQLDELKARLAHQSKELADKQHEIEQLSARLDQIELTPEDGSQLEQLEQELRTKEQQFEVKQAALQAQLNAKQQQLHESTELCERLEAQLKRVETQLRQLKDVPEQSSESELLKTKLEAREQELEELREQLQFMRLELLEMEENMQRQLTDATALRAELEKKTELLLTSEEVAEQLRSQLDKLQALYAQAKEALKESQLHDQLASKEQQQLQQLGEERDQLRQQLAELQDNSDMEQLTTQLQARAEELQQLKENSAQLQQSIDTLNGEKQELIKALQQKHAENTQYYAEIQRLQPLEPKLAELIKEREKLCDQISFLKEKSDILTTNLLTEQTNQRLLQQQQADAQEQQASVQRDLERLRAHLVEIEELHTQESVQLQRELDEARDKQAALQHEVSKSSNAYTSASIRANQQAETLQAQHVLLLQQRDELLAKLGQHEDREQRQQAALTNLQCALEQFQNDKEHDIATATQRMRREMQAQLEQQAQLKSEMNVLQQQLADANQGLRAASRLSDQLEAGQQTIAVLRDEVDSLKEANLKLEQSLSSSESSQTDKIDKSLIKSLLIGYVVSGHAGDKQQVLRMISTLLDFSDQEANKVGLNKPQSSWLGSILGGGSSSTSSGNDNLLQAFVQFLEQESQPQSTVQSRPNLLSLAKQTEATATASPATGAGGDATTAAAGATSAAAATTATGEQLMHATPPSPAMPPMQSVHMSGNEFAPTRNSSSILKDILSDT